MPSSANIFVNFEDNCRGSFHENKIQQLEKFMKDLAEMEVVNSSKIFKKFLEFDQYFDEENDILFFNTNINRQNLKNTFDIFDSKKFEDISISDGYNDRYSFLNNNLNKEDIIKYNDIN